MKEQVNVKIEGIKCDNPGCDYVDTLVNVDNFKEWVNRPCPKCGEILLNDFDYKFAKFSIGISKVVNKILPKRKDDAPDAVMTITKEYDGKLKCHIDDKKQY